MATKQNTAKQTTSTRKAPAKGKAPAPADPKVQAEAERIGYRLTAKGKKAAEALAQGSTIEPLACKITGSTVRWNIRKAIILGLAEPEADHATVTTLVNQHVANFLREKGRDKQCLHRNGERVKWCIIPDARTLEKAEYLEIIESK